MSTARIWGGEGTRTLTGGHRPRHVPVPAPHYIAPLFSSDEWWHQSNQGCMDAPEHIARGGVIAYTFGADIVLFASEPRP